MLENCVVMNARVLRIRPEALLVRDRDTGQTVQVNTPLARRFRIGQRLRIVYNGAMTMSIPPQISPWRISPQGRW